MHFFYIIMCSFLVVGDRFVDMEADQYSSVYRWVLSLEGGSIPIYTSYPFSGITTNCSSFIHDVHPWISVCRYKKRL